MRISLLSLTFLTFAACAGGDKDEDGLTNGEEEELGTDPESADSDGDGLDDGDEVDLGSDPLDEDSDDDGLLDGEEVDAGTDPLSTDTDGDGFTDAFWHLSPHSPGPNLMQVVAVSITDNAGKVNFNTANRFHRKDYLDDSTGNNLQGEGTRGHTPADIALVSQNEVNGTKWRVGFRLPSGLRCPR